MPLLALLLLAAEVARSPVAAPLTRSYPGCVGVRVLAPGLPTQPRNLVFSSRQVLDLQFQARLRLDLQGDHLMQFKVLTPGGFLYQVITVPFVGTVAGADARTRAARARSGAATRAPGPPPPRPVPGYPEAAAGPEAVPHRRRRTDAHRLRGDREPAGRRDVDHLELALRPVDGAGVPRRAVDPLRPGHPVHDSRLERGETRPSREEMCR